MKKNKQIPYKDLEIGKWYVGRGRNSNIGQWNGRNFTVISECMVYTGSVATVKETRPCIKHESYYTENEGCFQPFKLIDEGVIVEPFGKSGWEAHYGSVLGIE